MSLHKRLLKHPLTIRCIAFLAACYMGFVYRTTRWQTIGWEKPQKYWNEGKPFIATFWHNRLLMVLFGWTDPRAFHVLISSHSDGQLIAKTVAHHGMQTIAGSSSKGGLDALRSLLKVLKGGGFIGITPDGPKGPRFEVSDGTINLAKLSGCDIIPFTYAIQRRKVLRSWDRFILALPFSKGIFAWGDPVSVPRKISEADLKHFKEDLCRKMHKITDEADALCQHEKLR